MEESQFVHDREIITVCCEVDTKHIKFFNVKPAET